MLAACAIATALLLAPAAPPAHAAAYRACALSLRDHDPPGRTPAYNLSVKRVRTSCATAVAVMKAFHRCRTPARSRCTRRVLRTWRCTTSRSAITTSFAGRFRCASGRRRVKGAYWQDMPTCFGAAARDPKLRCYSRARTMVPGPGRIDSDPGWMCTNDVVPGACTFGYPHRRASGHFAVIGDSHVYHWRSALRTIAAVHRWAGYSFATGGCFFSTVVGSFSAHCERWFRDVVDWFRRHPEVATVFVTSNADTPIAVPAGRSMREVKVEGFARAWAALPPTVRRIVVLRDTPRSSEATRACIERIARARDRRLAPACPLARSYALREDVAVVTARRLRSPRVKVIDLTRFMCGATMCYPVVGGALVPGDHLGHVNATFMRTLGPYLLRELRRVTEG